MRSGIFLFVALFFVVTTAEVSVESDSSSDEAVYSKRWLDIIQNLKKETEAGNEMPWMDVGQNIEISDIPFECPYLPPSASVPYSAHAVRPGDIKIVAALGDSITAGNGVRAETPLQVLFPNRGESWSIGGDQSLDDGIITLTNILRKYNPDVKGYSICGRTREHPDSGFNVAVPGATHRGLDEQAADLINSMLTNTEIDYHNDWKIITLFIGGNDLCRSCTGDIFSPENYKDGIKSALDMIHRHVPRAIVNLQVMMDIAMVADLNHPGMEARCEELHWLECPCAMEERQNNGTVENGTLTLRERQLEYYNELEKLISSGVYDNRSDFTVVLQPHLRDQGVPAYPNGTYDMTFIAPDCFHPSAKAHQAFALMLWDVMLTPVGSKPFEWNFLEYPGYICPTEENPYFYTNLNSPPPTAAKKT